MNDMEVSMLSLNRRVGQVVYIGPNIKISISSVSGNQVRLGIEAPDDLLILREELLEKSITRMRTKWKINHD